MGHSIVEEARRLIGVKFRHQGRSAETGVDCLGLLVLAAKACDLRFEGEPIHRFDRTDYGHNPDTQSLRDILAAYLQPVTRDAVQPGDVALFHIQKRPQHMAIISDYPAEGAFGMIHAYAPQKRVVEHRFDESWQERLHSLYRFAAR